MTHCTIGDSGGRRPRASDLLRMLASALALTCLAGCVGGSGSSGFDLAAAENAAIDRVLDGGACVAERGLTICASGMAASPAPSPTSTPPLAQTPTAGPDGTPTTTPATRSPTPTATLAPAQPAVDVAVDPADVAACAELDASNPCTVGVLIVPMAVPGGAAYRVAVRTRLPDGPWRILVVSELEVAIEVAPGVDTLQTAILVYDRDPGPVPAVIRVLADSGADFAFVTAPFAVRGGR
ncbi:MAG: hypothetical protein U0802_23730 [Candidatus Binatia bacterium]